MDHLSLFTVAFVTGGGRGIGRAAALALADAGASVAICARTEGEVHAVAREIEGRGGRAEAFVADVTDAHALAAAVREAEGRLGPIGVLVCNSGIAMPPVPTWQADPASWWRVQEVNVLGVLHAVHAVVPGMVARAGGRVIHVASLIGARPSPVTSAYACSKAALLRLNDCLAAELDGTGVVSLAMSPGLVSTAMTEEMARHFEVPDDAWSPIEAGAQLIVRMASGDADALSGRMLHVQDDLDEMLRRGGEIRERGWYQLRLTRGLEGLDPQ